MISNQTTKAKLGRTRLNVFPICFGSTSLASMPGTYGYEVNTERALATVRAIFDGPTNFLDTSRSYGLGRSEQLIGEVIRERGGLPEGFVLSTKLDRDLDTRRFDGAQARRSLEESLRALGLDRVQLLHLHDPEHARSLAEVTGPGGALDDLFRIKEEGLAEAVGLAAGNTDVMMPLLRDWDFDALITHNRFTLVNRNATSMIDFAAGKGIAVINAAPYAGGVLAKGSGGVPSLRLPGSRRRNARSRSQGGSGLRQTWRSTRCGGASVLDARPARCVNGLRGQPAGKSAPDARVG